MSAMGECCDHLCLEVGFSECAEVLQEALQEDLLLQEQERLEAERQHDENTLWCHLALED